MSSEATRFTGATWAQLGLELVVVVVGILLALGIDSWVEGRRKRELETDFLAQLRDDLARAEAQIAGQLAATLEAEEYTLPLLSVARGEADAPNDTIARWLIRSFYFSDPRPTVSAAEALARSESLFVLSNPSLRLAVTSMIDRIRQVESRLLPYEQRIITAQSTLNRWAPPPTRGLPQTLGMIMPDVDALRSGLRGPVTADMQSVVRNPEVAGAIDDVFWAHENLRWYQQEMIDATIGLRRAVDAELQSR